MEIAAAEAVAVDLLPLARVAEDAPRRRKGRPARTSSTGNDRGTRHRPSFASFSFVLGARQPLGRALGLVARPVDGRLGGLRPAPRLGGGLLGGLDLLAQGVRLVAGALDLLLGDLDPAADPFRLALLAGLLGGLAALALLLLPLGLSLGLWQRGHRRGPRPGSLPLLRALASRSARRAAMSTTGAPASCSPASTSKPGGSRSRSSQRRDASSAAAGLQGQGLEIGADALDHGPADRAAGLGEEGGRAAPQLVDQAAHRAQALAQGLGTASGDRLPLPGARPLSPPRAARPSSPARGRTGD